MKKGSSKKETGEGNQEKKQGSLQIWTRSKTKSLEMVTFYESIIRDGSKRKVKFLLIIRNHSLINRKTIESNDLKS